MQTPPTREIPATRRNPHPGTRACVFIMETRIDCLYHGECLVVSSDTMDKNKLRYDSSLSRLVNRFSRFPHRFPPSTEFLNKPPVLRPFPRLLS